MMALIGVVLPMLLSLLLWILFGDFFHRHSGKTALVIAILCVAAQQLQPLHFSELARARECMMVFLFSFLSVWVILDEKVCSTRLRRLRGWLGKCAQSLFGRFF